jgi:hypothetical protein
MFMMKKTTKKVRQTPEQKTKAMQSLVKKFSESESGRSITRFMQMANNS